MTTPRHGTLFHFTHIDNLASIVAQGLRSDMSVRETGAPMVEVGDHGIKAARRERVVPVPPGGVVADYVPFYFAARSPMLFSVAHGGVETYDGGQADLIYLVATVARIVDAGLPFAFTDRNAKLAYARFSSDVAELDDYVDWTLMRQMMWTNTATHPDRKERRMAEFLVHRAVPWQHLTGVATSTDRQVERVEAVLATVGVSTTVLARPDWYF